MKGSRKMKAKELIKILKKHPDATIIVVDIINKKWTDKIWVEYASDFKDRTCFAIASERC